MQQKKRFGSLKMDYPDAIYNFNQKIDDLYSLGFKNVSLHIKKMSPDIEGSKKSLNKIRTQIYSSSKKL